MSFVTIMFLVVPLALTIGAVANGANQTTNWYYGTSLTQDETDYNCVYYNLYPYGINANTFGTTIKCVCFNIFLLTKLLLPLG